MSIENPEIRKEAEQLNQEGWENNAAVRVGKKEDMPRMVEQLETEGKAADLGTFIKLNKKIEIPSEELDRLGAAGILTRPGDAYWEGLKLRFLDKSHNLACAIIDHNRIGEPTMSLRRLVERVTELGLIYGNWMGSNNLVLQMPSIVTNRNLSRQLTNKLEKNLIFD